MATATNSIDEISPHLAVGIEIPLKTMGETQNTCVRGWKPGIYILADLPIGDDGDFLKVIPETSLSFRLVNEGFIFSCSTSIMAVIKQPVNIIVLEYPTRYEKIQMRKFRRYKSSLPAVFYNLGASDAAARNKLHKVSAMDISVNGALVCSPYKLDKSSRIALSIKLSPMEKITNIVSVVKGSTLDKKIEDTQYYLTGVEFQNVSEENRSILMEYIKNDEPFHRKS